MRNGMTRLWVSFLTGTLMLALALALSILNACVVLQNRLRRTLARLERRQSQVRPSPPTAWRGTIARRGRSDGT